MCSKLTTVNNFTGPTSKTTFQQVTLSRVWKVEWGYSIYAISSDYFTSERLRWPTGSQSKIQNSEKTLAWASCSKYSIGCLHYTLAVVFLSSWMLSIYTAKNKSPIAKNGILPLLKKLSWLIKLSPCNTIKTSSRSSRSSLQVWTSETCVLKFL